MDEEEKAREIVNMVYRYVDNDGCLEDWDAKECHVAISKILLAAKLEERKRCLINYKRLIKIFLGEDAEIEFSEKMAKGWDNLMKFMDEESAPA